MFAQNVCSNMNHQPFSELPLILSGRNVTAVLGPTNTGKTHLAIERMLSHSSGVMGLPLRLLAREVYSRVADRVGTANVSLVTGEEKIVPPGARYYIAFDCDGMDPAVMPGTSAPLPGGLAFDDAADLLTGLARRFIDGGGQ